MVKVKEKKISKMAAMREALASLGPDDNDQLKAYLKDKHGLELSPGMFSNYKTTAMKELAGGKPKGKQVTKPAATAWSDDEEEKARLGRLKALTPEVLFDARHELRVAVEQAAKITNMVMKGGGQQQVIDWLNAELRRLKGE